MQLTVIHTCAFHFIRNAKEIIKRTMKVGSRNGGMWMLSLLMNKKNIRDLERAIKLIIAATCSNYLTNHVPLCIRTLNKILKDLKADILEEKKMLSKTSAVSWQKTATKRKKGQIQRKITISNVNTHHSK